MNSYMNTISVLALALLFMMGCATERVMTTTSKQFPPTNPDTVKIYLTDKPTTPYEEIGRVSVDKYSMLGTSRSGDVIYKNLCEKASSIGGDAIIKITEDFASMSGVVVKMLPKKKGTIMR